MFIELIHKFSLHLFAALKLKIIYELCYFQSVSPNEISSLEYFEMSMYKYAYRMHI